VSNPLEQFIVKPIIPIEINGIDFSFTQSALWMCIGVACTFLLMSVTMRKKANVPGRWQNLGEVFYEFIASMVKDSLGDEGRKYFPLVFSIFMIVLMGNLLGLIPYSFTYTSHIIVTGALALFIFILATIIGFARHGFHFFSLFLPEGTPVLLAPLMIVIEVISYLSRPISLSLRLFINMVAGHTLLKVLLGFTGALTAAFGIWGTTLGLLPVLISSALIGLEVMICFIQAYIFAMLTCVYLRDSIHLH